MQQQKTDNSDQSQDKDYEMPEDIYNTIMELYHTFSKNDVGMKLKGCDLAFAYKKKFFTRQGGRQGQRQSLSGIFLDDEKKRNQVLFLLKKLGFINEIRPKAKTLKKGDKIFLYGGLIQTMRKRVKYALSLPGAKDATFYGLSCNRGIDNWDDAEYEEYDLLDILFPVQNFFPFTEAMLMYYLFCLYTCGFKESCSICREKNGQLKVFQSEEQLVKSAKDHGLILINTRSTKYDQIIKTEDVLNDFFDHYIKPEELKNGNLIFVSSQPFVFHHIQKLYKIMKERGYKNESINRCETVGPGYEQTLIEEEDFSYVLESVGASLERTYLWRVNAPWLDLLPDEECSHHLPWPKEKEKKAQALPEDLREDVRKVEEIIKNHKDNKKKNKKDDGDSKDEK